MISLPIMEDFLTLQGEGYYTGQSAYFIRLGGCDVGCVWCDVKESWDSEKHPKFSLDEIQKKIESTSANIIVITGGEPMMHDLTSLVDLIHKCGKRAHVETSGTHPITGNWDWVTLSPKKFKELLPDYYTQANELKVIVYHPSDIAWANDHASKVNSNCKLYLQPEWSKMNQNTSIIIEHIQKNPKWTLSLQTHKWIGIE
jgi:organic radical activating enzyme